MFVNNRAMAARARTLRRGSQGEWTFLSSDESRKLNESAHIRLSRVDLVRHNSAKIKVSNVADDSPHFILLAVFFRTSSWAKRAGDLRAKLHIFERMLCWFPFVSAAHNTQNPFSNRIHIHFTYNHNSEKQKLRWGGTDVYVIMSETSKHSQKATQCRASSTSRRERNWKHFYARLHYGSTTKWWSSPCQWNCNLLLHHYYGDS